MNTLITWRRRSSKAGFLALAILMLLAAAGCRPSGSHTSDPRLRQIDEMLNSQLPQGTSKSRVIVYLNTQGFTVENSGEAHILAATVHHVDTETLQPVNASVRFHFDSEDKLTTYELSAQ